MTTVYFVWDDGHTSAESFKDSSEFYQYMDSMAEDGHYPESLSTQNANWATMGANDRGNEWIEIEIAW